MAEMAPPGMGEAGTLQGFQRDALRRCGLDRTLDIERLSREQADLVLHCVAYVRHVCRAEHASEGDPPPPVLEAGLACLLRDPELAEGARRWAEEEADADLAVIDEVERRRDDLYRCVADAIRAAPPAGSS